MGELDKTYQEAFRAYEAGDAARAEALLADLLVRAPGDARAYLLKSVIHQERAGRPPFVGGAGGLHYEVLWGGYPLVHNSALLKDYGYYYRDFDAEPGADALLAAIDAHEAGLEAYRRANAALFRRLDPTTPQTIAEHERLLAAV